MVSERNARIKIGRVTLKGGAHLLRLDQPEPSDGIAILRDWFADVVADPTPPDAFLALSWIVVDGKVQASATWYSSNPAFPARMLPVLACETARGLMTEYHTERSIMQELGYQPVDPGPAA